MKKHILILLLGVLSAVSASAVDYNPIIQTKFTADPAPVVVDDTLYLFTSHDNGVRDGFDMTDWQLFTTIDMVNWTDHGAVASLKSFGTWASTADNGAWAVQAIKRNDWWYMYCPVQLRGVGVLRSPSPYGPWSDPRKSCLFNFDIRDIDPTVFIDDDDQAYIYWGNNGIWYAKLNKNMTAIVSSSKTEIPRTTETFGGYKDDNGKVVGGDCYEEGPWVYKREGHYYLVYAAGGVPEHISYAMSDKATGPWVYKGKIMDVPEGSFTIHPGVVDYKGHSFLFYHSGQLPDGGGYKRSVCVEEFKYKDDGTIPHIKMTRSAISKPVDNLNALERQEAETIAMASGLTTKMDKKRGVYVDGIDSGDYIWVRSINFGSEGANAVDLCVKSADNAGRIEVSVDNSLVAKVEVADIADWTVLSAPLSKTVTGIHNVRFRFVSSVSASNKRQNLFFFDYWQFRSETNGIEELRMTNGGSIYDLRGQQVARPRHGLFIHQGKKIIIK